MPDIYVNDVPQALDAPPATWGDLLASLDEQAAGQGVLLTLARFDGVEEPSFRDPAVTARRLSDMVRVDVETAAPNVFLRQCIVDAIRPLEVAADRAAALSVIYRGHDVSAGHDGLTTLASELHDLTSLAALLSGPLQIDLNAFSHGDTEPPHVEALGASLAALVAAQETADWLTVADVLEYDLEPAIRRWAVLLNAVAARL